MKIRKCAVTSTMSVMTHVTYTTHSTRPCVTWISKTVLIKFAPQRSGGGRSFAPLVFFWLKTTGMKTVKCPCASTVKKVFNHFSLLLLKWKKLSKKSCVSLVLNCRVSRRSGSFIPVRALARSKCLCKRSEICVCLHSRWSNRIANSWLLSGRCISRVTVFSTAFRVAKEICW